MDVLSLQRSQSVDRIVRERTGSELAINDIGFDTLRPAPPPPAVELEAVDKFMSLSAKCPSEGATTIGSSNDGD